MQAWIWVAFSLFVLALIAVDLGVASRRTGPIKLRESLAWTGFYVCLALAFNAVVYVAYDRNWILAGPGVEDLSGSRAALQFFTAWLVEKSLSLDNIFVIALIFTSFRVPLEYQHRVLFWGILGALVMRAGMIAVGAVLVTRFTWTTYVFGGLLLATAVKMLVARHDNLQPERNPLVRLARRLFPVTEGFRGPRFFVREAGVLSITPLFLALLVVEATDLLFAVDSIPAVFAVTTDPFLVFTSNVFAILGLRSLYFALAGLLDRFRYLKMSLVFLLAYVGVKMLLAHHHPIPNPVSLAVIAGILSVGVLGSLVATHRDTARLVSPLADDLEDLLEIGLRQGKRIVILVFGGTLLLLGAVMLLTPGPGFLTLFLALSILGVEFAWARLWLRRLKATARSARSAIQDRFRRRPDPTDGPGEDQPPRVP